MKKVLVSEGIISIAASEAAQEIFKLGTIPDNFSNNQKLLDYVNKCLTTLIYNEEEFALILNSLDLLKLEYDEAVLLGILELLDIKLDENS